VGSAIRTATTAEQLLHGEPHLGNLLRTRRGLLVIDLETCCRGPVEFDIAHGLLPSEDGRMLPAEGVWEHYPAANQDVINQCRILIWAMITTWRWQRDDQLPNGRYWRIEGLNQLRCSTRSLRTGCLGRGRLTPYRTTAMVSGRAPERLCGWCPGTPIPWLWRCRGEARRRPASQ